MSRPKIHVTCTPEPIIAGGESKCKCEQEIRKSYVVRLILREETPVKPWHMCQKCWDAIWNGTYNTLVCEADSVPDLLLETESVEGE